MAKEYYHRDQDTINMIDRLISTGYFPETVEVFSFQCENKEGIKEVHVGFDECDIRRQQYDCFLNGCKATKVSRQQVEDDANDNSKVDTRVALEENCEYIDAVTLRSTDTLMDQLPKNVRGYSRRSEGEDKLKKLYGFVVVKHTDPFEGETIINANENAILRLFEKALLAYGDNSDIRITLIMQVIVDSAKLVKEREAFDAALKKLFVKKDTER